MLVILALTGLARLDIVEADVCVSLQYSLPNYFIPPRCIHLIICFYDCLHTLLMQPESDSGYPRYVGSAEQPNASGECRIIMIA